MSSDRFMIDSFISYMASHPKEDPFSDEWKGQTKKAAPSFNFYKIIGALLILGLGFVLICAPILCICMLVINDFSLEGAWLFWIITAAEIGYLVWRIIKSKNRRDS